MRPLEWAAACAALLLLQGCPVENQLSFSPGGDLAFTTQDAYTVTKPGGAKELVFVNRLLVLRSDRQVREFERTTSSGIGFAGMLAAAGFSPDGRKLAYLRFARMTEADSERVRSFLERLESKDPQVQQQAQKEKWIFAASPGPVEREPRPLDQIWGDSWAGADLKHGAKHAVLLPVELVVRDAAGGTVERTLAFDVPIDFLDPFQEYEYTALQWLPGGDDVLFHLGGFSLAANLSKGTIRLIAASVEPGRPSPDARQLASARGQMLELSDWDAGRVVMTDMGRQNGAAIGGPSWAGPDAVAVLQRPGVDRFVVQYFDRDGRWLRSVAMALADDSKGTDGEMAISPDGRHIAIVRGGNAWFLSSEGRLAGRWVAPEESARLARATFSPDSQNVAFRQISVTDHVVRTEAIVFFSAEGKQLFRVPVPPAGPVPAARQ